MPVDGAEFDAEAQLAHRDAMPHLGSYSAEGHETAHQMQPMHRSDQVEKRIGWIGREEVPLSAQLAPRQQLSDQECNGGCSARAQADDETFIGGMKAQFGL